MRPVIQMLALTRLLILAWLMTWVATSALFTTYLPDLPDTTYGQASLQCAYQEHFSRLSNRVSHFEDFNVAVLEEDDKSKKRKVGQPSVIAILCHVPIKPPLPNSGNESHAKHPGFVLLTTLQGSRAPPSLISF